MIDVVESVRSKLETELPCRLFTKRHGDGSIESERPNYPYALFLPVSKPVPTREWEVLLGVEVHAWGSMWQMGEVDKSIAWLDGHYAGDSGDALGIIFYRFGNGQIVEEPEVRMLEDGADVYHLRAPYRASYGDRTRLEVIDVEVVP